MFLLSLRFVSSRTAQGKHLTKNFESKLAEQQKQIEALTEGILKVSAQLELSKPAPQTVNSK
jgi:hypothetical protein